MHRMESEFLCWMCMWYMASNTVSASWGALGNSGVGLEVGHARSAPVVAWGSICIWGPATAPWQGLRRHKAQLQAQLPQLLSCLNREFCLRASSCHEEKLICCGLYMFLYDTKKIGKSIDGFSFYSSPLAHSLLFVCLFVCCLFCLVKFFVCLIDWFFFWYVYLSLLLHAFSFSPLSLPCYCKGWHEWDS